MHTVYQKLLSTKRARASAISDRNIAIESESDRARLVFSSPFRRLQQKAQVFSLEENAAVRSRLTHSLEVAQIGRFIANQVSEDLIAENFLTHSEARAFVNFVEVACLMHDLGNPPFGHFGEAAIASWFKENGELCAKVAIHGNTTENLTGPDVASIQETLADFVEFDGNCQGLRIASLLQWNTDPYGLNLTFTSLASYLKYLRAPLFNPGDVKELPFRKKAGFFSTEKTLVEMIWSHFNYSISDPQRFPLAYIMEAADDIAYCISDLEDSIEKELLQSQHVFIKLNNLWTQLVKSKEFDTTDKNTQLFSDIFSAAAESDTSNSTTFTTFRTRLSRLLTDIARETYRMEHDKVLSGDCSSLIPEKSPGGQALKMLKNYCIKNVYQHPTVQRPELAGLTAIKGLLDHFKVLLMCSHSRFRAALNNKTKDDSNEAILIERKLLALFPEKHKKAYKHSFESYSNKNPQNEKLYEWNLRCHLIVDFVSGMTDDFALSTYQMLSGIKVK